MQATKQNSDLDLLMDNDNQNTKKKKKGLPYSVSEFKIMEN